MISAHCTLHTAKTFLHCVLSNGIKFDISAMHTSTETTPQGSNKTCSERGKTFTSNLDFLPHLPILAPLCDVALIIQCKGEEQEKFEASFFSRNNFFHCLLIKAMVDSTPDRRMLCPDKMLSDADKPFTRYVALTQMYLCPN